MTPGNDNATVGALASSHWRFVQRRSSFRQLLEGGGRLARLAEEDHENDEHRGGQKRRRHPNVVPLETDNHIVLLNLIVSLNDAGQRRADEGAHTPKDERNEPLRGAADALVGLIVHVELTRDKQK